LDGKQIGTTPFKGKIKKGKEKLTVRKSGYGTESVELKKRDDNFIMGNVIFGVPFLPYGWIVSHAGPASNPIMTTSNLVAGAAIVGLGVGVVSSFLSTDGVSGASWEYSPSKYYVQLKKDNRSGLDFSRELAIRYFSTVNHSQIAIDAGENTGEYVKALVDIMENEMDKEKATQSINEALEKSHGDQLIFADKLIASCYRTPYRLR